MTRRPSTRSGRGDARQFDLDALFEIPQPIPSTEGSLDYESQLCRTLSRALKETPRSRAQVAADMSVTLGKTITESMLNTWTAESRDLHRFPFAFAAAFEAACETTCLQQILASKRGSVVMVGEDALLAELGRLERTENDTRDRRKQLRALLKRAL